MRSSLSRRSSPIFGATILAAISSSAHHRCPGPKSESKDQVGRFGANHLDVFVALSAQTARSLSIPLLRQRRRAVGYIGHILKGEAGKPSGTGADRAQACD